MLKYNKNAERARVWYLFLPNNSHSHLLQAVCATSANSSLSLAHIFIFIRLFHTPCFFLAAITVVAFAE